MAACEEEGYKPGPDFEEDSKDPLLDISLTDSTELWLIQWPINQLQPADFNGKELTLKLHRDGQLGNFESSSGKSYDVVSFAAQEPDATVFLGSGSGSRVVGKISRRVCLVRYPEAGELEKPSHTQPNLSRGSQCITSSKLGGSQARYGTSHDTITSMDDIGQKSSEFSKHSNHKRRKESNTPSGGLMRSSERSSLVSGLESRRTDASLGGSEKSHGEKLNKKKKKMKFEE